DDLLARLADLPPFDRIRRRDLLPLRPFVDRLRVPAGTTLARRGQLVHEVVVVLDGEVAGHGRDGVVHEGPGALLVSDELARDSMPARSSSQRPTPPCSSTSPRPAAGRPRRCSTTSPPDLAAARAVGSPAPRGRVLLGRRLTGAACRAGGGLAG